jgi:hypothetical protein
MAKEHRPADADRNPGTTTDSPKPAQQVSRPSALSPIITDAGLLTRDDAGPGQRAAYSLTEAAIQLVPVLTELGAWGIRHRVTTPRLRVRAELLASGGPEMQAQFMDELREQSRARVAGYVQQDRAWLVRKPHSAT